MTRGQAEAIAWKWVLPLRGPSQEESEVAVSGIADALMEAAQCGVAHHSEPTKDMLREALNSVSQCTRCDSCRKMAAEILKEKAQ